MPEGHYALIPPLIEVGRRTTNVLFLIESLKVGPDADPASEVDVTLFPGAKVRLSGDEAREWAVELAKFVPTKPSAASGTVRGRGRRAKESG